jgi:hypothetical protein
MWKSPDRLIQVKSSLERYKLIPGVLIMKEGDTSSPTTAAPRSGEESHPKSSIPQRRGTFIEFYKLDHFNSFFSQIKNLA